MSLYQAEKLIDLACSTTYAEEARTAALAACKLIRKHGLRLTADPLLDRSRGVQSNPAPRPRAEPRREKPPNGGAWARATRAGRCESCGGSFAPEDEIYMVAGAAWCARH